MVKILNAREVATSLRVSMITAYKLMKEGQLPARKVGKEWRVTEDALHRFLNETARKQGKA